MKRVRSSPRAAIRPVYGEVPWRYFRYRLSGSLDEREGANDDDGARAQVGRGQGLRRRRPADHSGAHYLRMSKKDLVEVYLNARREEMQAGMRELLSQPDGSRAGRVAMLAGMTSEELEAVASVEEVD